MSDMTTLKFTYRSVGRVIVLDTNTGTKTFAEVVGPDDGSEACQQARIDAGMVAEALNAWNLLTQRAEGTVT